MDHDGAAPGDHYDNTNRAFLQALMARGSLTFPEGQKLIAAILAAERGERGPGEPDSVKWEDFEHYIQAARSAVESLDFDIRATRHQVLNGERVWVFINAQSDAPTQMGTVRTPEEVSYLKRLLDAMFNEYNTPRMEVMAVDEAQALKVSRPQRSRESGVNNQANGEGSAAADRGLKHSEVLSLLSSLVAEGWLEKSRHGFYSLSPRSLVELWSWLVETYNDPEDDWQNIKFCEACKEIVTYGQRCSERDCTVRLHDFCQEGYWRTRRDKTCPKCKRPWDGKHFVGERAVTSGAGFQRGRGRKSGGSRAEVEQDEAED
ncbi:Nse1 non-SMC component of SMC5-6 complex-domain-containing protein [Echria macrotheca]|uniref:Non-structural maintenance of chromosomes element 1 homolog n=1 Tax=Echria macrotheca TaxID=438768 RepID=A0AAJ0BEW9_9PEZI|nr:Nse1 non-SMC component of SMC5-6 complex-domain-containing protein [Echria macrotheca]